MHLAFLLAAAIAAVAPLAAAIASQTTKFAVLGATGNLGRRTVREFLDRGIPVRCLVRPSSADKIPAEFRASPLFEAVSGDLLADHSRGSDGIYRDDAVAPSAALLECLGGCGGVVACYGAVRRTRFADFFRDPEDTDPTHAKQINCRSMIALVAACRAVNAGDGDVKIAHVVRITGKGEDPTGFFSVLLNGLGAYCKAWNYQGEAILRSALGDDEAIGYTIVRPGILTKDDAEDGPFPFATDDLVLADDGGNDLPVTKVGYSQIACLLADVLLSAGDGRIDRAAGNQRVTLAAMNPPGGGGSGTLLGEKIAALRNDRRDFPVSLVAEHKAAVRAFFSKVAAVASIAALVLGGLVSRALF